ncbi:MAG: hypothetical protein AB7W47_16875 [Calditrichaceae bacterium]
MAIFCFLSPAVSGPESKNELIREAVRNEMNLRPESTLIDLYKLFFQGAFGPGHMIANEESAKNYLQRELQTASKFDSVLWQEAGYESRYYRVSLTLIEQGRIPQDSLLKAFIGSANSAAPPSINAWKAEWEYILNIIQMMEPGLPGFDKDMEYLQKRLSEGKTAVHHSERYSELYHPHYRIVNKDYYEWLRRLDSNSQP